MEAHGHEDIISRVKDLLKEKLTSLGLKENTDFDADCLYIGNWIADLSQITDESLKFPIYKFIQFPNELNKTINNLIKEIENLDINKLIVNEIESFTNKKLAVPNLPVIELLLSLFLNKESEINLKSAFEESIKIKQALINGLKDLSHILKTNVGKSIKNMYSDVIFKSESNQNPAKFIEKINKNPILNKIEYALILTAKLIGFNKFCLSTEGKGIVQPEVFDKIFEELYKKYLPFEHLDRPIDYEILKKYIIENINSETYSKKYSQIYPKKIIDRKNIASTTNSKLQFSKYLDDYLNIVLGKLAGHEKYFKELKKTNIDKVALNLEIAKFGNTLHVFEDYFAHSNFIDYNYFFLYSAYKQKLLSEDIEKKVKPFFNLKDDIQLRQFVKTTSSLNKIETVGKDKVEEKNAISTGYFGWEETKVSLAHVLMGKIAEISETNTDENLWSNENVDVITSTWIDAVKSKFFIDEKKISEDFKKLNEILSSKDINKDKTIDVPDFITIDEVIKLFTINGNNKLIKDPKSADYIKKIINSIVAAKYTSIIVNGASDVIEINKKMQLFIETIITIFKVIRILITYTKSLSKIYKLFLNVVKDTIGADTVKLLLKDGLERILNQLAKKFIFPLLKIENGSHALLAKDDAFEQPRLNQNAKVMALNLDKFIINNIFYNKENEAIKILKENINKKIYTFNFESIDYDVTKYIVSDKPSISIESIYKRLKEKDSEQKTEGGLHKEYTNWDYIKSMISFKNGVPLSFLKLPTFKINNLNDNHHFRFLPDPLKSDFFNSFIYKQKSPHTINIYKKHKIDKLFKTNIKPDKQNEQSYKILIDEIKKKDSLKLPDKNTKEDNNLHEIEITAESIDRWFFKIIVNDIKFESDLYFLNYILPKSKTETENKELVKIKDNVIQGAIKDYREIAILTTYLKEVLD